MSVTLVHRKTKRQITVREDMAANYKTQGWDEKPKPAKKPKTEQ